jgi:hypothetical protein
MWSSDQDAAQTAPIFVPKYPTKPSDVNLSTALEYNMVKVLPAL